MASTFSIRPARAEDAGFLAEVLAIAADWRPAAQPRSIEVILAEPGLAHYVQGWPRDGDFGVVAEAPSPVGATWWRFFDPDDPGFGFVADTTPEITVGVIQGARRRGVGRAMLDALIAEAERRGLPSLCLSVEPDNYAMRLYERVGFRVVDDTGGAVTMLRVLTR